MAVYKVTNHMPALHSVEFTPVSEGNVAFFTAPSAAGRDALLALIQSSGLHQRVTGETTVDGKPVFITSGHGTQGQILEAVKAQGAKLSLQQPEDKNHSWKVISMLAVPGQFLQLASGLMRKNNKPDWGMLLFAGSNLLGHAITWHYGAQSYEDTSRLAFLKGELNKELAPHLAKGDHLPGITDSRKELRHDHKKPDTLGQKLDTFLEANSIYVGEIACRYLGAIGLAFPPDRWRDAITAGSLKTAANPNRLAHYAGLASLSGKTLSLMATADDPYNKRPPAPLDTFREKIAFQAGGWVEAGAFGTLTYDALTNPNRRITIRGREYRDYVGALGSALFTARYIMRHWAKFGERRMDMDEVYAHATDSLAKMPQGRIADLVTHTATTLAEHFKDQNLTFGEVYTRLKSDLYTYHHIVVPEQPLPETQQPRHQRSIMANAPAARREFLAPRGHAQPAARPLPGSYAEMVRAMDDGNQLRKGA